MHVEEHDAVAFTQRDPSIPSIAPRMESIVPAEMCPGMIGYGTPARRPCHRCTSVPQTSEHDVRNNTAPSATPDGEIP